MAEILDKEERSIAEAKGYALTDRWQDPQVVRHYFKKEKHAFAIYHECRVQKLPKTRIGRFFREDVRRMREVVKRRRSSASTKSPITTSPGHVPIETVQTFIELLELPRGWNSYNAKQIRKENVNAAISLLGRIMQPGTPAPIVVPKVRGGVQLEWHTRGVNLEIAIDSPEHIAFFAEDIQSNEEPEHELNESTITEWIDRISE
jgi:hypothetical protein